MNRRALALVVPVVAVPAGLALGRMPLADGRTTPSPPVVTVTLAKGAAPAVSAPAQVGAGPVRFTIATAARSRDFTLVKVPAGSDPAATQAAVRVVDPEDPDAIERLDIVAGATAAKGHAQTVTATLETGSYLVADTSGDNARRAPSVVIAVDAAPSGARAPKPAATVSMQSYKYTVSGPLPRNGVVRFTNPSRTTHMAVAFKVRDAARARSLVTALKRSVGRNAENVIGRYARGGGAGSNPLGAGRSQDLQVSQTPGAYVFVCFWASKHSRGKPHFALGMAKAYRVR